MNITIRGCNPRKARYISSKVEKYLDLLGLLKQIDDKHINIFFVKHNKYINKNIYGSFVPPILKRLKHKPNVECTTIYLNKDILNNRYLLLTTLMHELVHLKQFATEKLKWIQYMNGCVIQAFWKKKKFGKFYDLDRKDLPWEREADRIEKQMWYEGKL